MTELVKERAARVSKPHPLLTARREANQLVLLTSDRGLCGGYNANLIRAAEGLSDESKAPKRKFSY